MSLNRKQMGGMSFIVAKDAKPEPWELSPRLPVGRAVLVVGVISAVLHAVWIGVATHLVGWW